MIAAGRVHLVWELVQRLTALLLAGPALLLAGAVGLAIRFNSAGPLFILQVREGKGGQCFPMLKLRTMVVNADRVLEEHLARDASARAEWDRYGRLARDPRVRGLMARLARRWSLDELPQMVNVVGGQMALVGPRPLPPAICRSMAPEYRAARQTVLPGLTGLWQVCGRSSLSIKTMGRIDELYVRRRSICLDLMIILRTPVVVISGEGVF